LNIRNTFNPPTMCFKFENFQYKIYSSPVDHSDCLVSMQQVRSLCEVYGSRVNIIIFWDVSSYSVIEAYRRFGRKYFWSLLARTTYSTFLKMKTVMSSEQSVNLCSITWCHSPGDSTVHDHRHGNFKSHTDWEYARPGYWGDIST
jgi:hypothetical protein